jgi:GntR family transcriptional regulator
MKTHMPANRTLEPGSPVDPSVPPTEQLPTTPTQAAAPAFSPLYQQIKGLILSRLRQGEWKPSAAIPSEMELAVQFRVSQGTVRKAIDELAAENIVVRRQGKGTFVCTHAEQQVRYRFLKLVPDAAPAQRQGVARRDIVACKRLRASPDVSQALNLGKGAAVVQIRRVLSFADAPVILEDIWLPAGPFKGLTAARLSNCDGAMYALFETAFGVHMVRADEKIRAVLPDAVQSQLLKVLPNTPLLSVERIAYTYDAPMELRRGLYVTSHHHYHNVLN